MKNNPRPGTESWSSERVETWIRKNVIHDIGHALGLVHEYLSPNRNIPWNVKNLKEFKQKLKEQKYPSIKVSEIEKEWWKKLDKKQVVTDPDGLDPMFIMMYDIPEWLINSNKPNAQAAVAEHNQLSKLDKTTIVRMYGPKSNTAPAKPT